MFSTKHSKKFSVLIILIFTFTMIIAGCATGNYGGVWLSNRIDDMFESHKVLEDYRYYYSGSDARPDAILGVDPKFTLESRLWKPVNLTPGQLRQWIDLMTDYRGYSLRTYGAEIRGPKGEMIGIWYSPTSWTTVKLLSDNRVVIYTPNFEPGSPMQGIIFGREKD